MPMFKGFRKALGSFLAVLLLSALIIAFALFGVGDIFTSRGYSVLQAGDSEVTLQTFVREFQNRVRTYQIQFGEFTDQQAIAMGLHRQVLSEMLAAAILDEDARALGIRATSAQVRARIREMEAFEGLLGGFDETAYRSALQRANYSVAEFEDIVRRELARQQVLSGLTAANPAPRLYADALYVHRKEGRRARILSIPPSSPGSIPSPDEAALREYYATYSERFMAPEYRSFQYIVIEPSTFAAELEISDEELRAEYEKRIAEFRIPDTREIEAVTFPDEDDAQTFVERVRGGESFVAVASEMTGFTPEELNIGEKSYHELQNDYDERTAERVFALGLGPVSELVTTLHGTHIFRVTRIQQGSVKSFEDARHELLNDIVSSRGLETLYDMLDRIDDQTAAGATVEDLHTELGLELHEVSDVNVAGSDRQGRKISQEYLDRVLPLAFQAELHNEPELISKDDEVYTIFEVTAIIPSTPRPYEEAEGAVRAAWIGDQLLKVARERANAALEEARQGTSFAALARRYDGVAFDAPLIQRDSIRSGSSISTAVANLIFSLGEGEVGMEQAATGDGYILAQVTAIEPGVPDGDSEEYKNLVLRLSNEFAGDHLSQYQAAAFERIEYTTNEALIDSVFTPDGIVSPTSQSINTLQ